RVPAQQMLSPDYLQQRANAIAATKAAAAEIKPGSFSQNMALGRAVELPSTSHLVIVDAAGNVVMSSTKSSIGHL
ncbi:MAG TPA: gamma-glutamyltransferase, partial [Neisseria sp.]|nr:gamma-glutamyltransferase [Neisseria sp.]